VASAARRRFGFSRRRLFILSFASRKTYLSKAPSPLRSPAHSKLIHFPPHCLRLITHVLAPNWSFMIRNAPSPCGSSQPLASKVISEIADVRAFANVYQASHAIGPQR